MSGDPRISQKQTIYSKMSLSPKVHSPYEVVMKKFSEDHKVKCRSVIVDVPKVHRHQKQFMTGSKYEGSWSVLGMSGPNVIYTFPNGVIYEGEFEDGMRHGMGEMRYPTGEIIRGRFISGRMVERTLIFADGLEYNDTDWMYCRMPDRRYTNEYEEGVMPAGNSYITADLPTREIPPGFFDTGDGFYDPKTKAVYKADDITAIIRAPTSREQKWIESNCRCAPEEPIGPRRDLYEDWLEPETDPAPTPLPSAVSRATAWMFESNRSMMVYDSDEDIVSTRDFSKCLHHSRPSIKSTTIDEPVIERSGVVKTENKSETEYILKSRTAVEKSTFDNRYRSQLEVEKPIISQSEPRKLSSLRKSAYE